MRYLVDTSALHRLITDTTDAYGWNNAVDAGLLAICDITELEVLYSARSEADRQAFEDQLHETYCWVAMPDEVYRRAREVQRLLTEHGEHRGPGPIDLLVAAAAELSHLTLLHCDNDFETVARRTGQPTVMLPGRR